MSSVINPSRLTIPQSLRDQLTAYRRRVWTTKMLEAVALAASGLLAAFLIVFVVDRFLETPRWFRLSAFLAALTAWISIPYALHHWVWRQRQLTQLAKLLRQREPEIGGQLLGVLELAASDSEQARSRVLCAAAIAQVAEAARSRDLNAAAPKSRVRTWSIVALSSGCIAAVLSLAVPLAAGNSWARLVAPWRDTPRYTFTRIQPLNSRIVVPHGESVELSVALDEQTRLRPQRASARIGQLPKIVVERTGTAYKFQLPPQTEEHQVQLRVGDYLQTIVLVPKLRPELVDVSASVSLPEYLQLPLKIEKDVRGGTLSTVAGSQASIVATASRELKSATIDDREAKVKASSFESPTIGLIEAEQKLRLQWRDRDDLAGLEPFELAIKPTTDEPPAITSQDLPRQAVVLSTEQLNFTALAADDFGVKRIGMSWKGLDDRLVGQPAQGERVLSAGAPDQSSIQTPGTFSAATLGIQPQPIEVRLWAEDYLPNRPKVESAPHTFYVLSPEQHAIWMTEQLSKWHRQALDVRDREMRLHETNKQLRAMSPDELASEDTRQQLEDQAAAEASNGRQLANLTRVGAGLVRQAGRNPEIGVGHLERWAEMLQIMNDISQNRMPSVADLLKQAAAKPLAQGKAASQPPTAGMIRAAGSGPGDEPDKLAQAETKPAIPAIVDVESTQQPANEPQTDKAKKKKSKDSPGRLGLPQTVLIGPGGPGGDEPEEPDSAEPPKIEQAIEEQADLLAEFERIADELNTILANLEGSTLVKRLKAAAREQTQVADRISERIDSVFGNPAAGEDDDRAALVQLSKIEQASSQAVSFIMDDMHAYYERRRLNQFKLVFDEMREAQVVGELEALAEELLKVQGISIAEAEYWSDSLDRWAEDLVDPACSGSCPGGKTPASLPPSVILEVLKILESEVNLREETRVAEKARPSLEADAQHKEADRLGHTQGEVQQRIVAVVARIEALPDGANKFGQDLALLNEVDQVMLQAADILYAGDTGEKAIAAETEAIELLLKSKRINPKDGGGGGTSPGGGGEGTTTDSALALIGAGVNEQEKRESREVTQATGETGRTLPEEFRAGLDEYFKRLEKGS